MNILNQESEIILDAIERDNEGPILELYKNGFDINSKFSDGDSLLHKCFARQKYNLTQYLILLGCDFNALDLHQRTPLHHGCKSGFLEGCKLLILLGADINARDHMSRTPLMHAIKYNKMLLIKLLMSKGCDSELEDNNGYSSLLWSMKFLTAKQLRQMLQEDTKLNERLNNQIENADEDKISISSDIKQCLNAQATNDNLDVLTENLEDDLEEVESVSYLKELFTKTKEKIIQAASYSIKEHLESLRSSKKEIQEFDYERKIINENVKNLNENDIGYIPEVTTSENHVIKNATLQADYTLASKITAIKNNPPLETNPSTSINEDISVEHTQAEVPIESDKKHEDLKNLNQSSSGQVELNHPDKISTTNLEVTTIANTAKSINHVANTATDLKNSPKKSTNLIIEDQEAEKEKKENLSEEKINTDKTQKNLHRHKTVSPDPNEVREIENILLDENLVSEIMSSKENETQPISQQEKLIPSFEAQIVQEKLDKETLQTSETKESIPEEENDTKTNNVKKKEDIIKIQKNVKYLRDGFSEVYKDNLSEIKHENKNIESDILGVLKSRDRVIKQELGDIKIVDKSVESDKELKSLEPGKNHIQNEEYLSNQNAPKTIRPPRPELITPRKNDTPNTLVLGSKTEIEVDKEKSQHDTKAVNNGGNSQKEFQYESSSKQEIDIDSKDSLKDPQIQNEATAQQTSKPQSNDEEAKQPEAQEEVDHKSSTTPPSKLPPKLSMEEEKIYKSIVDVNQKNSKGQSLCWLAAEKGQSNLLKKIIHDGADYEVKDPKGVSCLMVAAINGHVEVIEYLAQKVRSVDEKNSDGNTALILAVENDRANIARLLIDNGANIETKIKGNNLLMHAAQIGAIESMKLFILLGLDPLEKNFRGKTAVDLAKTSKNKKALLILNKLLEGRGKTIKRT